MKKTLLLIDGDLLAYRVSAAIEEATRWDDGVWTYTADENVAFKTFDKKVKQIVRASNADDYIICYSDTENFRKEVFPDYKSNRVDIRRPLVLNVLVQYGKDNHPFDMRPRLEADDLMGILATSKETYKDNKEVIIATLDKDLMQIPVPVFNFQENTMSYPKERPHEAIHYAQCLAGDRVDGYLGCPGIGIENAYKVVQEPFLWECYEHEFKSGKRAGTTETRWKKSEALCSVWESIVSHYEKAGQTEEDALQMMRCAYILRAKNYDLKTNTIKLWEPKR